MRKYSVIIFDFDGTLGDTGEWFLGAVNKAAKLFRFKPLLREDIPRLRELETRVVLRELDVALWKLPWIALYMRRSMGRDLKKLSLFPGVPELLRRAHGQGMKLVIVSSNSGRNIKALLPPATLALIDRLDCGSSLLGKKEKFLKVAEGLRVPTHEVLCIGDESRDIEAAREAGMDSVAVTWGYAGKAILERSSPTYLFERIEDLLTAPILEAYNPGHDKK